MKFSCMMELNKYPLDVQVCTMEVASCEFNFIQKLLFTITEKYDNIHLIFTVPASLRDALLFPLIIFCESLIQKGHLFESVSYLSIIGIKLKCKKIKYLH